MTDQTANPSKRRISLQGKLLAGGFVALLVGVAVALAIVRATNVWLLAASVAVAAATLLFALVVRRLVGPTSARIAALIDSADSLRDADFSFTIADRSNDELGDLVHAYNLMVGTLRQERQNLHQRELMLDTVLQASPLALVLCSNEDRVIYANATARNVFSAGKPFAGRRFMADVAKDQPDTLQQALANGSDALITIDEGRETERYHLSCNEFTLNARAHRLFLLKRLTNELNRQEVATWKKVIRLIGHELNNSLAPISSLAHSGQLLVERNDSARLGELLKTIEVRSGHLKSFIEGYSRFAKLPAPQKARVPWRGFIARIRQLQTFEHTDVPEAWHGTFDPRQLEQVLINLCKNAQESGSAPEHIQVTLEPHAGGWQLCVKDRGRGMNEEALVSALLPFYSTKKTGSGLGLSLCREIVDAHEGRISLRNRKSGGVTVAIWLP
ncbi:MAG: ATP-binding protein [Pseudomonadota bacterium]